MSIVATLGALLPFAGKLADGWGRYQERKSEKAEAKHVAELKRIEATAEERARSWKDEYILIVTSYPIVSVFIPPLRDSTMQSLEYLADLPPWLIWSWLTIVGAVYGAMKLLDKVKIK